MANLGIGNLYDINKKAILAEKPLTRTELKKKIREIKFWMKKNTSKYYMLLNRESYDFTLFNLGGKTNFKLASIVDGLEECLINRGLIISIDKEENMNSYEIWMKIDNKAYVYYLFPYNEGVIE